MNLRTRLLLAFAIVAFIPLALLAIGLRHEMANRLSEQDQQRVDTVVAVIEEDLRRESNAISERLASLKSALGDDNRFRLATVAGLESERPYLLDYAGTAMRLTGLSMLEIQDGEGRIISSGHFRNEHGRVEIGLAEALDAARDGVVFVTARGPEREFLALARSESLQMSGRTFTLVGGVVVDDGFLEGLARDREIVVSLRTEAGGPLPDPVVEDLELPKAGDAAEFVVRELPIPVIRSAGVAPVQGAEVRLRVSQPLTPLRALLGRVDSLFLSTAIGTAVIALLLAAWVSSRISRPLTALADKTSVLDLDRLDIEFDSGKDEVGTLSRLLGDLVTRLRTSTVRVREAERRATVGDLARQINHDIKNGLVPLRNVVRHLEQISRDDPGNLQSVFAERQPTVDSSIAYLETLATNYERLSSRPDRRECNLNALAADVVRGNQEHEHVELQTHLSPDLPPVLGDPIALRRILENLMTNAIDSLQSKRGRVTLSTELDRREAELPTIRVIVADTGPGMSADESAKIFTDFYTTKEGGAGLGLSIVRRLVLDLRGALRVESEPGAGTRMIVDLPVARARR